MRKPSAILQNKPEVQAFSKERHRPTFKCRCSRETRFDKSKDKGQSQLCNRCIKTGDAFAVPSTSTKRLHYICQRCGQQKRVDLFPVGSSKTICKVCKKKAQQAPA